ncbi:MAG TPA: S49 family peptidase [Polyangia bacterium]|jgi:protease-4
MPETKRPAPDILGAPVRLIVAAVVNLALAPRNLVRALRRKPQWVRVRLDGALPERPPKRRFLKRPRTVSLAALADVGRALARDRGVHGVLLEIDAIHAGWARLASLRNQIAAWRALGKRVVAHLSSPGNAELFVAMACDEILCDESGPISLTGLATESGFYGEALRRLGVDAELEREGPYKSYAETFTRSDMSAENKEALDAILDGMQRHLLAAIADGRRLTAEQARALVDAGPYLADSALKAGLVDAVLYRDQVPAHLGARNDEAIVGVHRYLATHPTWFRPGILHRKRRIAVLSLEGNIVSGPGSDVLMQTCGAETANAALRELRKDPAVAAVVLHVDSRGGSAPASDRIWREVKRLGEEKPVVAVLGDVAASGGYYVVAPCAHIVAQPTTLTGSIGVVAGKLAFERLLEKLGVGTALLVRGQAAAMRSVRRRYDEVGRRRLREELLGIYRQFVGRVQTGRGLEPAAAEAAAKGRVWTGEDAQARRLVDELGGMPEAIAAAKARARRHPGEELQVFDYEVKPELAGLKSLIGEAQALERLVGSVRALLDERVLLYADRVPKIR